MSSSPKTSIVLTTFNRAPLLECSLESFAKQEYREFEVIVVDDGSDTVTPKLCAKDHGFPLQYFRLNRDRTKGYNNPCVPNNVGVRQARGEVIILQNAEIRHSGREVIKNLTELCGDNNAVFAQVETLNEYGMGSGWYCHRQFSARPFFFCGALRRSWFEKLRGFDEDYKFYGWDDVDFADRLAAAGVVFDFTTIEVQHQFHGCSYNALDPNNSVPMLMYYRKKREMAEGKIGIERNLERDWGKL